MNLRDIVEITNYRAKVILRLFDFAVEGKPSFEDVELTLDNVDKYESCTIGCLVPMDNELLIEGTM